MDQRLAGLRGSRAGQFITKLLQDEAPNLAALLAWGTLSTLLPLLLGVLAIAGLLLRDQQRLDQIYSLLLASIPQEAAEPIRGALDSVRATAGAAGLISLLLLIYNGSRLFATMQTVFNRAYYVDNRNFLLANAVAVLMLLVITVLLLTSTVAVGAGSLLGGASDAVFGALPIQVPGRGLAGQAISWGLSALSAVLLFVLLYKILPNARQGWRDVLPGALAAIVLFFVILLVFPIYVSLFPPNQAYAAFGIFLVFTFYLYLLGFVFVFGAELNAFLQDPTRAVALAETAARARRGEAALRPGERLETEVTGSAPSAGPGPRANGAAEPVLAERGREGASPGPRPRAGGVGGRMVGVAALLAAAMLVRGRTGPDERRSSIKPPGSPPD
jgi:membrane protein